VGTILAKIPQTATKAKDNRRIKVEMPLISFYMPQSQSAGVM